MDNNIYWFDSLERKRGILKGIELSEFSRIATSSNFDNLVLYEDKRPECSASIACYEILKSYDGAIGQQLYSPKLKWKLLLDKFCRNMPFLTMIIICKTIASLTICWICV